jgi:hypothetical protein
MMTAERLATPISFRTGRVKMKPRTGVRGERTIARVVLSPDSGNAPLRDDVGQRQYFGTTAVSGVLVSIAAARP